VYYISSESSEFYARCYTNILVSFFLDTLYNNIELQTTANQILTLRRFWRVELVAATVWGFPVWRDSEWSQRHSLLLPVDRSTSRC